MKRILGLDLGTNSIGWAMVEIDHDKRIVRIIALGSRIIPMGAAEISTYESGGKLKSSAADKTTNKGIRKNISRALLRRDRLHCVLNLLNMLPKHYKLDIEFVDEKGKRSGKIIKGREPKIAYYTDNSGKKKFLYEQAYNEMETEFKAVHPELFQRNRKNKAPHLPYDWTLYYLRKKALHNPL
ncbi:MAG: type II CRISPR RNA-guided endonuclease Cas9, partial [Prevotella sp.]|nr:type II CRISPR RNA-guided endonuclease Cas9 [Prevotella sp.]